MIVARYHTYPLSDTAERSEDAIVLGVARTANYM